MKATTFVTCPVGTRIENYTHARPKVGEVFDITHIDTKKVVQRAQVTRVEKEGKRWYKVVSIIVG